MFDNFQTRIVLFYIPGLTKSKDLKNENDEKRFFLSKLDKLFTQFICSFLG